MAASGMWPWRTGVGTLLFGVGCLKYPAEADCRRRTGHPVRTFIISFCACLIMSWQGRTKARGSAAERELVHLFWDAGWAAFRSPASGAMQHDLPDVIAGHGSRKLARKSLQ